MPKYANARKNNIDMEVLTPEKKARKIIDQMLLSAGWDICDRSHYTPLSSAVAIEEGLLRGNLEADYLLFIDGRAVAVLEAKRHETPLNDKVYQQAYKYTHKVPSWVPAFITPLPLIYLSNGETLLFKDTRTDDDPTELKRMHTPKEMAKILNLEGEFAGLPALRKEFGKMKLRDCQVEAIRKLELSFRNGERRALFNIATGAGKTYTACLAAYRMLNYTPMKRILFLVDRNNLGEQAADAFARFRFTENGETFSNIFSVERIRSTKMPDACVTISTIQRLFSMLTGKGEVDDIDEESNFTDEDTPDVILPAEQMQLPHDYFDLIIVDECHRSIYSSWRRVLEYFDTARIVGLTATPVPQTLAFFNMNKVVDYTLEKSIADGVNVAHRTYRINTQATQGGGIIHKGDTTTTQYRYDDSQEQTKVVEDTHYEAHHLNRDIVNPMQIRTILEEYRRVIYTQLYPEREPDMNYIPKTLIFAQDEAHAERIVQIAKDVFERPDADNTFVQKITYSVDSPRQRIKEFRTDRDFRIAVTVTLVATGTDVKPLEVVMFMRDVESDTLFKQMKGRGCRRIDDNSLRNVTPNADTKDVFYLIDCVGVTEHGYTIQGPTIERGKGVMSLETLLERITLGNVADDMLYDLAGRISRINNNRATEQQRQEFTALAGRSMYDIASDIYQSLEALPPYESVNAPNTERRHLVAPLANHPDAREKLLFIARGSITILQPGEDEVIQSEFSHEEANRTTEAFEQYIQEHRDDIEALRIIFNNDGTPLRYDALKDLENKLKMANYRFATSSLWKTYSLIYPDEVTLPREKDKLEALTNIIQLVRFALRQQTRLVPFSQTSLQRFELWCGHRNNEKTRQQHDVLLKVIDYICTNGFCTIDDLYDIDMSTAAQIVGAFGSSEAQADEELNSLARFIIYETA